VDLGPERMPAVAAFLNVEPVAGGEMSAVMFRVAPDELSRLIVREKNYEGRNVRDDVRLVGGCPVGPSAVVWCFVGRDEQRVAPSPGGDVVLLTSYLERVIRGARFADPDLEARLRASADASGFRLVDGSY